MEIYSYYFIKENNLNKKFLEKDDFGVEYFFKINYDKRLVVNMPFLGKGAYNANSLGWKRDKSYYFNCLLKDHPDAFSNRNIRLITEGISPLCDKRFSDYFVQFKGYEGQIIIHHHVGQDGQVVAVPSLLHKGFGGVHNAEKKLGINKIAKDFTELVQEDFDKGNQFNWARANNYKYKVNTLYEKEQNRSKNRRDILEKTKKKNLNKKVKTAFGTIVIVASAIVLKKNPSLRKKLFDVGIKFNNNSDLFSKGAKKIGEGIGNFKNANEVSPFKDVLLQSISLEEKAKKLDELSKLTGKDPLKWLQMIINAHGTKEAKVLKDFLKNRK